MIIKCFSQNSRGQTLITLLFIIIVGITITTAAAIVVLVNSQSTSKFQQSNTALSAAESGIENALLILLRDPNYTGETMNIGNASVIIEVSGDTQKIITSTATISDHVRQIQVEADYNNNILTVSSWKEIY